MPKIVPQNRVMSRQIGAAGHHIDALHDDQHEGQAERQRHEQEVIERGQRELQPRKVDDTGIHDDAPPQRSCPVDRRATAVAWDRRPGLDLRSMSRGAPACDAAIACRHQPTAKRRLGARWLRQVTAAGAQARNARPRSCCCWTASPRSASPPRWPAPSPPGRTGSLPPLPLAGRSWLAAARRARRSARWGAMRLSVRRLGRGARGRCAAAPWSPASAYAAGERPGAGELDDRRGRRRRSAGRLRRPLPAGAPRGRRPSRCWSWRQPPSRARSARRSWPRRWSRSSS